MALGGITLAAVYAAGYTRTEAAARQLATPPKSVTGIRNTRTETPASATSTSSAATLSSSTSRAQPALTVPSATAATGTGNSPFAVFAQGGSGDDGRGDDGGGDDGFGDDGARHDRRGSVWPRPSGSTASVTQTPTAPATPPTTQNVPQTSGSSATQAGATSSQTSGYKDGTYTATGYGRHGPVEVQVVIQGGKIVSAAISRCGTHYSCAVISRLPGEVVARQSAQVDFVSGATDSSIAYQQAVAQALSLAG